MTFGDVVHIIPLGYEIDRAVAPFRSHKANRAHVLSIQIEGHHDPAMSKRQQCFIEKVVTALEALDIKVNVWDVDLFDMHAVMRQVSQIIRQEKGNQIFVNMSACGRFTSIGAALAGLAHDASVYYVEADAYPTNEEDIKEHGYSICTSGKVKFIDNFKLQLPDEIAMQLLVELTVRDMDTKALLDFMVERQVGIFADTLVRERRSHHEDQRYLTSLNKTYLDKLVKAGYIEKKKIGNRRIVKITEAGRSMAAIAGLTPSLCGERNPAISDRQIL